MAETKRDVTIEFPDKARVLRFDIDSLADMEEYAREPLSTVLQRGCSFAGVRMMVKFGLQWKYPDVTIKKAGALAQAFIDQGRTLDELFNQLLDAVKGSGLFHTPKEEGDGNPQAATAGPSA